MVREYTSTDNYSFAILLTCLKIGTDMLRFSLRSSLAGNVDLYISNGNLDGKHWIFGNSRPYVSNDFDGFSNPASIPIHPAFFALLQISWSVRTFGSIVCSSGNFDPRYCFHLGGLWILASNAHLRTLSSNGDSVGWILIDLHFSQATYMGQHLEHLLFIG